MIKEEQEKREKQLGDIAFFLKNYSTVELAIALAKIYEIDTKEADELIKIDSSLLGNSISHSTYNFISSVGKNSEAKIIEVINYLIEHRINVQDKDRYDHGDYVRTIVRLICLIKNPEQNLLTSLNNLFAKMNYPWNVINYFEERHGSIPNDDFINISEIVFNDKNSSNGSEAFSEALFNRKLNKNQSNSIINILLGHKSALEEIGGQKIIPLISNGEKPNVDNYHGDSDFKYLIGKTTFTDPDKKYVKYLVDAYINNYNINLEVHMDIILKILNEDELKKLFNYCISTSEKTCHDYIEILYHIANDLNDISLINYLKELILKIKASEVESNIYWTIRKIIGDIEGVYFDKNSHDNFGSLTSEHKGFKILNLSKKKINILKSEIKKYFDLDINIFEMKIINDVMEYVLERMK